MFTLQMIIVRKRCEFSCQLDVDNSGASKCSKDYALNATFRKLLDVLRHDEDFILGVDKVADSGRIITFGSKNLV